MGWPASSLNVNFCLSSDIPLLSKSRIVTALASWIESVIGGAMNLFGGDCNAYARSDWRIASENEDESGRERIK